MRDFFSLELFGLFLSYRLFDYGDEPEYDEVDESELQQPRTSFVEDCELQNKCRRSQKSDVNQSPHLKNSGIHQAISSSVSAAGNDSPPTPSLAVQASKHKVSLKKSSAAPSAKKILTTSKSAKSKTPKTVKSSKVSRLPILASVPGAVRPSPELRSSKSPSALASAEDATALVSKRNRSLNNSNNTDAASSIMTGDSNMTSDANNVPERASIGPMLSAAAANSLGERGGQDASGIRREQQVSSSNSAESMKHFHYLTLTVRKDENGYGMKVDGGKALLQYMVFPVMVFYIVVCVWVF